MISDFASKIDISYSLDLIDHLISYESNPELGYRTSGSAAEFAAADYLFDEMKKIGLRNVRKEAVTVDNFEFKRADLSYRLSNGQNRRVALAAFQARCYAENKRIKIVYAGKGRDRDYEGLDVEGKFVLVDIDMMADWFVNWPVGQALMKKAAGIILVQVSGYCSWSKDTLGVQDISTEANLPCFSISVREAEHLKKTISAQNGEAECILNADVDVRNNGMTHCLVGEIPGQVNEVIYLIAHYDAYFRAYMDNSAGVGCVMGICKALLDSGYNPRRTLRVILHGAEEWGIEGTRYDWARGATMMIRKHPEWGNNGFMLINIDGNVINSMAETSMVRTSYEMARGIRQIGCSIEGNIYPFEVLTPLWTWSEDYMYAMLGIPTIKSWYEPATFWPFYHSSSDLKANNDYSDEAFRSSHILYGSFLQRFDALNTRPVCFNDHFEKLDNYLQDPLLSDSKEILKLLSEVRLKASLLEEKARTFTELNQDTVNFNEKVSRIFRKIVNDLYGLDWYERYHFIFARNLNNMKRIQKAAESLKNGNSEKAIWEDLRELDLFWYACNFDYKTYCYFVDQVLGENAIETWAKGKVQSAADVWQLSRELIAKSESGAEDYSRQISTLEELYRIQEKELKSKLARTYEILTEILSFINEGLCIGRS